MPVNIFADSDTGEDIWDGVYEEVFFGDIPQVPGFVEAMAYFSPGQVSSAVFIPGPEQSSKFNPVEKQAYKA